MVTKLSLTKVKPGYTVLELLITVSILMALTGISLISFAAPRHLIEKETLLVQVTETIQQARLQPMLQGKAATISITPWTMWLNDKKQVEFTATSGWQWKGNISLITIQPDTSLSIRSTNGKIETTPQEAVLTYNQSRVAAIVLNPQSGTICIEKNGSPAHVSCTH